MFAVLAPPPVCCCVPPPPGWFERSPRLPPPCRRAGWLLLEPLLPVGSSDRSTTNRTAAIALRRRHLRGRRILHRADQRLDVLQDVVALLARGVAEFLVRQPFFQRTHVADDAVQHFLIVLSRLGGFRLSCLARRASSSSAAWLLRPHPGRRLAAFFFRRSGGSSWSVAGPEPMHANPSIRRPPAQQHERTVAAIICLLFFLAAFPFGVAQRFEQLQDLTLFALDGLVLSLFLFVQLVKLRDAFSGRRRWPGSPPSASPATVSTGPTAADRFARRRAAVRPRRPGLRRHCCSVWPGRRFPS